MIYYRVILSMAVIDCWVSSSSLSLFFFCLFVCFCYLMDSVSDLFVLIITVVVSRLAGIWLKCRV